MLECAETVCTLGMSSGACKLQAEDDPVGEEFK